MNYGERLSVAPSSLDAEVAVAKDSMMGCYVLAGRTTSYLGICGESSILD